MNRSFPSLMVKSGLVLTLTAGIFSPMAASAHDQGRYYYVDDYNDGYYSCRERRNDNATGGVVAGAIVGGAAGAVPGAVVGAIIGGAVGSESTTCRRHNVYAYDSSEDYYYDDRNSDQYDRRREYRDDRGYRDREYDRRYERRYRYERDW